MSFGLYKLLYMYIPGQKPWNVSVRFFVFHVSNPKAQKYTGNAGTPQKPPGNMKLSLLHHLHNEQILLEF